MMIYKTRLVLALVIAASTVPAMAQTPPPPPPPEAKVQAAAYVMAAGMSDMFEIESSRVAVEKSRKPEVRRYAQMLIAHHQKTTAATMKAARKAGLTPIPPAPDAGTQASIAELRAAAAADFDRVYLAQQVPAHRAALDLHKGYAAGGDQAPLRTSANSAVPIVQQHLTAAERMLKGAHDGHSM